eukprot:1175516-Prorocentrum_minimum.AAC.4
MHVKCRTRVRRSLTLVARSRSDARPDFRSGRAKLLGGDPPAGGPRKEAAQRQGRSGEASVLRQRCLV